MTLKFGNQSILFWALLLFCKLALAIENESPQQLKQALLQKIDQTQQQLEQQILKQSTQEQYLRQVEAKRSQAERQQDKLTQEIKASEQQLEKLIARYASLSERSELLSRQLADLMYINYSQFGYSPLRVLQASRDKRNWARHLVYLRYVTSAQLQLTTMARALTAKIQLLLDLQLDATATLKKQKQQQQQLVKKLKELSRQRKAALAKLRLQITTDQQKLTDFKQTAKRIEKLAISIGGLEINELTTAVSFNKLQGKLPLPIEGMVGKDLTPNGLTITASYGQPVKAVASGRVAYANWISGLGLVLILDHGDDYITLYAHNQHFAVRLGEWVQAGRVISYIGNSGGSDQPKLWFQLWFRGKPLDPSAWMAGS